MNRMYDRQGNPISLETWAQTLEGDPNYRRVAQTTLPDRTWISTVWLGLDHRFGGAGPPIIFESIVFARGDPTRAVDMQRYTSEAEARAGHEALVAKWSAAAHTFDSGESGA